MTPYRALLCSRLSSTILYKSKRGRVNWDFPNVITVFGCIFRHFLQQKKHMVLKIVYVQCTSTGEWIGNTLKIGVSCPWTYEFERVKTACPSYTSLAWPSTPEIPTVKQWCVNSWRPLAPRFIASTRCLDGKGTRLKTHQICIIDLSFYSSRFKAQLWHWNTLVNQAIRPFQGQQIWKNK